jgi:hypothetical protein
MALCLYRLFFDTPLLKARLCVVRNNDEFLRVPLFEHICLS